MAQDRPEPRAPGASGPAIFPNGPKHPEHPGARCRRAPDHQAPPALQRPHLPRRHSRNTLMRALTASEQRTIRIGAALLAVYFLALGGWKVASFFERRRVEYIRLVEEAQALKEQIRKYESKADAAKKLMEAFKLDPARLSRTTMVAEASAAIQKAAAAGGVGVGPIRESPARAGNKELATVQLEATGPPTAVTSLLGRLESLGFPMIVESVQMTAEPMRPGAVKVNLTIVILDFEQWKKEDAPHA